MRDHIIVLVVIILSLFVVEHVHTSYVLFCFIVCFLSLPPSIYHVYKVTTTAYIHYLVIHSQYD